MTYRHELKFLMDNAAQIPIRMRLSEVLKLDAHINHAGYYTVRSLYFDDYYNSAYREKDMSILNRQKYRIRLYNNSDQVIHLERKIKSNNYILKESTTLSREEAQALQEGDYLVLKNSQDRLKNIFYHECVTKLLRPRVVVDYEREPYIMDEGTVRITFDKDICAGVDELDIFNPKMAMVSALPPNQMVMEVKYTSFLPSIVRDVLPSQAAFQTSLSKYVLCCEKTMYKRRTSI